MSTRGRPPTITDEALLAAARSVFIEQGVGATTAEIARRAGISESVIFHRYKSKEALFLAVLDAFGRMAPALERLADRVGKGTLDAQLFDLAKLIVEQSEQIMPLFNVAALMARASNWKLDDLQERMRRHLPARTRALKLIASYFEAEADHGRMRPVDSDILARAFIGAIGQHIMERYWIRGSDELPLSTPIFLRGLIDIVLRGSLPLKPKASRKTS